MAKLYDKRWRYVRNIGCGGQGSVVLVADESGEVESEAALKRLTNAESAERKDRFERETNALDEINHPNILRILHKQLRPADGEKPFFVAEYCSGGSLQDRGAAEFADNPRASASVLIPIALALEAAHARKIFHRDCKPANILFRENGTPVLGDFGICYAEDGGLVTLADEGIGSKNFIAPEMESGGNRKLSEAIDVYSIAKVFYWMISGGKTIAREEHRAKNNNLALTLDRQRFEHVHMFLDKFLQAEPQRRKSMSTFRRDLEELVMLVEGDFVPLTPSLSVRCRFCGLGTYQRSTNESGYSVPGAGLTVSAGNYVVAMWCDHCGHIQSFNLRASGYREWWNGNNSL
ncbi:MAG: serine/threonine-protein kinase [Terriglobia bacterium]|nr:serine/threonine-protein kinase [Terriglobia bacterium]